MASTADIYDYVIVGGGTSGLTLASRLAEDAHTTICVLEAGEDVTNQLDFKVPGAPVCPFTSTRV